MFYAYLVYCGNWINQDEKKKYFNNESLKYFDGKYVVFSRKDVQKIIDDSLSDPLWVKYIEDNKFDVLLETDDTRIDCIIADEDYEHAWISAERYTFYNDEEFMEFLRDEELDNDDVIY